jgi:hypothetical protein
MDLNLQREFEDARLLVDGMLLAGKYGLEAEFAVWFIRGMRQGEPVGRAVNDALAEWDI